MVKSLVSECSPGGNSFAMLSYIHLSLIITRIGSSWYVICSEEICGVYSGGFEPRVALLSYIAWP